MSTIIENIYDKNFYKNHSNGSFESAKIILRLLFEIYKPNSVLDVGCGTGSWLAAAELLGARTLVGYDGSWVDKGALQSNNISFNAVNLEKEMKIEGLYDLAISVEVAEHLPKEHSEAFVRELCHASSLVIFSAAIKGQGGTHHINEQWQSYWIKLFSLQNFEAIDIFRYSIWNNKNVELWYKQNLFLFINPEHEKYQTFKSIESANGNLIDVVHPQLLEHKIKQLDKKIDQIESLKNNPTIKHCIRTFVTFIQNKLRLQTTKKREYKL